MKSIKRKYAPVHAVCRNCGTELHSRYCHNCGQDLFAGSYRTVKDLIVNAFINVFNLDNKLLVTLKYLFFYPGKLSAEYTGGRIVRYVHPSKLFWVASILFIAVLTIQLSQHIGTKKKEMAKEVVKNLNIKKTSSSVDDILTIINKKKTTDKRPVEKNAGTKKIASTVEINGDSDNTNELFDHIDGMNLLSYFSTYSPYIVFLLMPFFALLLCVFFRKHQRAYVDHLTFAIHFHSFLFLFYTILMLTSLIPHIPPFYSSGWLTLAVPFLYFTIAAYVFYHPKLWTLAWKIFWLTLIYFIGILIVLISILAIAVKLYVIE
ncbi:MAG: DUF3667 domain-containing protein [Tannerella sp.]|jgi:hypothetical protein|nr:DUF3667 domain-containing protein [Tannerella sp.]